MGKQASHKIGRKDPLPFISTIPGKSHLRMWLCLELFIADIYYFLGPYIILKNAYGAIRPSKLQGGYGWFPSHDAASENGLRPSLNG